MSRVVIIGGGAAGMAAAAGAAQSGHTVAIYEKNEKLGKKLYITGKGRCNLTNACDTEELFTHMVSNGKFLYSAIYGFTNFDIMDLVEESGCPLKTERGGRVFPASDKSSDVISALMRKLRGLGVEIHLNQTAGGLYIEDGRCRGILLEGREQTAAGARGRGRGGEECAAPSGGENLSGKRENTRAVLADAVIVATGGLSYPATGSTGDGYRFAREADHTVMPLRPALVPFTCAEEDVKRLQGLSLRNIEAAVLDGKKVLWKEFGELLFTHFGVSGPVVLSASSYAAKLIGRRPLSMTIDLKPALSAEQLDARILRDFEEARNKQFKNALSKLYPAKLIPVIISRSGIDPDKKVNVITAAERGRLAGVTKEFTVTLTGLRGFNEAIITQGGVDVREVNPSTMESRKVRGLYFAGEVLDLDGVTGGFNLQIAWSTGMLAGRSIPR